MPGMELRMGQRLEHRLQLQQALGPGDMVEPFWTEAEQVQVSQYALLSDLTKLIEGGEFFDPTHFALEINRTMFDHPLEAKLWHFGRDLAGLVHLYQSDDILAKRVLSALSARKEGEQRKDLPAQIAAAWGKLSNSDYFRHELRDRRVLAFLEKLKERDADVASGVGVVANAAAIAHQQPLVETTLQRLAAYADRDARLIPFTKLTIGPMFRAIGQRGEQLTTDDARTVYTRIVESLYMLDRDLRVTGIADMVAQQLQQQGMRKLLASPLPVPIQAALDSLQVPGETSQAIVQLCDDRAFTEGRERQRQVYRGLAAIAEMEDGAQALEHVTHNASTAAGFARVLAALSLVYSDPAFSYPLELSGEDALLRNLRLQLIDKSIKRLGLRDEVLERYLGRLETDERFVRIGKIITTLAGYQHYQNDQQLDVLRQITEAELDGKFTEWRYRHARAKQQLAVLGEHADAWRQNGRTVRLVGELHGLQSHIDAIKDTMPKLMETYSAHYNAGIERHTAAELEQRIGEHEPRLHGELSKGERKDLGHQTSLLREQLAYVRLFAGLAELTIDNYPAAMAQAEELAQRKSKNPLHANAVWVRETLDQPAYRDARRVVVTETDDLEALLCMGERPVPNCQNWQVDSTLNQTLLSFAADANKKLYLIANGGNRPISMTVVRLMGWNDTPVLLAENVYRTEWSEDYGIALLGSLADKALAIHDETGKTTCIATNHPLLIQAMEKFGEKYHVEVSQNRMDIVPPPSMNPTEYWDCGPGIKPSGSVVALDVHYLRFGGEER